MAGGVTLVFPMVTSFSESVVSMLRCNTWQRAKSRQNRKHRKQGKTKQDAVPREEQYTRLITSLALRADRAMLVCIPPESYPESLLDKHLLTDFIRHQYLGDCSSPTSQQKRSVLLPRGNVTTSLRHTMTSPLHTMKSPHQLQSRHLHTSPKRSDGLSEALESIVRARAQYEAEPTADKAVVVATNERKFRWYKMFTKYTTFSRQLNFLKEKADKQPGNAHTQALYLAALHSSLSKKQGKQSIVPLVDSKQFAVNSVIVGMYLEAGGVRVRPSDRVWLQVGSGVRETWDVTRKLGYLLLSGVILFLVYNSVKGYSGGEGGGGIQRLLVEDKSFEVLTPDVTFKDVAGNQHVVEEMKELVNFLTEPDKYEAMGCNVPKGYLFCGPPGVGKTLMAKALAGEAGVPFYYASGSAFEEVFVGVGAGRVRKLFEDAQENAPSIIFIDEIDSIGQKRGPADGRYTNRSTLNQILSCMDGFESNSGVIVIAATNDPNVLDAALMREGRFDTKISIRAPSLKGRLEMLQVHTANKLLADGVDLEYLATACVGMTGAQLANLANTAALRTVLEGRDEISQDDFEYARARLLIGHINEDLEVSASELENTAAHEAGHALLTVLREDITKRPVYITTILPRGGTLGHVLPVPKTDQHSENMAQMIAMIDIAMAGRVGEELHFGFAKNKVTTGCSSDMANATRIAEALIKQCGYSKLVGLVKSHDSNDDMTDKIVHDEIKKLFDERYKIVKDELVSRKKDWKRLTDTLIQYKTLTGGEVKAVLDGGVPDRMPGDMLPSS